MTLQMIRRRHRPRPRLLGPAARSTLRLAGILTAIALTAGLADAVTRLAGG